MFSEKKHKKKQRKESSKDEEITPVIETDQPTPMTLDNDELPQSSEKKRDKKKKRKESSKGDTATFVTQTEPGEPVPIAIDTDELEHPSEKNKKDRKRKRDTRPDADEPETNTDELGLSKKQKKKKRDKLPEPDPQLSVSIASPAQTASITPATPADASAFIEKHSIIIHTPPSLPPVVPVTSFDQLCIPDALKIAFQGFKEPTPIQACAWPPALQGHDVVGIAETGSGKTLAFGIPALARLISVPPSGTNSSKKSKSNSKSTSTISVLVVAPTRELALQTHDTLSSLGAPFNIASVAVFGGVDKAPQIKALTNGNREGGVTRIVVGTPGRILDLVNEGTCDLSRVNYLVLDEADRMLDKGFENDIRTIISHTMQGSDRQTMMFSATWPEAVRRLASTFQLNPVRVTVGSDDLTANSRVEQIVEVFDDPREKDSRLTQNLKNLSHKKTSTKGSPEARILVFALYKKEASRVESNLHRLGYSVGALHGDMSQSARMEALEKFKTGETGLLVATDVAARGLDIPNVGAVINYTFPLTIEDYIHRIGRTGRGGRSGKSITFFTGENHERALAGELARVLRESNFDEMADRLKQFPMTIKKKTHGSYGAFFRDDIKGTATKIVFD
ncbi:DEAD-domain-containing protein [Paxillus ammoniavirescens]|nr:DEAD-domain-containing protein [Paxillus ammoniavirescens]